MVQLSPFEVEQWLDRYENTPGVLNIAETCASSISLDELVQFNSREDAPSPIDFSAKMTYGAIRGSEGLRQNIADTYADHAGNEETGGPVSTDNVLVAQGAIGANYLVFYSLVGPGDHVICVFPTYQQLYSVPESLDAEVSLWKLKEEDGYVPDVTELKKLIKGNTKMIVINNPNNPTGIPIPRSTLAEIIGLARERNIIIFSDEVYRPLFHSVSDLETPPSAISLGYVKTVVTGSMSKAWALAGIRVGWIVSRDAEIIERLSLTRDYTTISVSQLDDQIARYALSADVRPQLLARNMELARTNLKMLDDWVRKHTSVCTWVKPTAGTTAFIQFRKGNGEPVDDDAFCQHVISKTQVLFVPGSSCFGKAAGDFRGSVRIGYANKTEVLRDALGRLSSYVDEHLRS
ncbi:PLP-dependent transferase [Xylariomycetidae sp. FL2044]|nr:PLP-dependent transferase [Xylariomycetidae sp. FL2044]